VILKNYPNSFLKTNLKELLDDNGIEEVTVVGAMSHMCIDATVRASSDFGYKTTVLHDACATRDVEFGGQTVPAAQVHTALMSALEFGYAKVVATDKYLEK
jgi:nicotinamidase-related amidase